MAAGCTQAHVISCGKHAAGAPVARRHRQHYAHTCFCMVGKWEWGGKAGMGRNSRGGGAISFNRRAHGRHRACIAPTRASQLIFLHNTSMHGVGGGGACGLGATWRLPLQALHCTRTHPPCFPCIPLLMCKASGACASAGWWRAGACMGGGPVSWKRACPLAQAHSGVLCAYLPQKHYAPPSRTAARV